jgi:hypothetical protein
MYLGRLVKDIVISSVTQSANLFSCGLNAHATITVELFCDVSTLCGVCETTVVKCFSFAHQSQLPDVQLLRSWLVNTASLPTMMSLPCSRSVSLGSI